MVEANKLFRLFTPPFGNGADGSGPTVRTGESYPVVPDGNGGEASALPSVSPEFQSELAALLAHYAARMAAARGSASLSDLAAALQAIANEQAVAMRALLDRWRTAEERQRTEGPVRPAPKTPRKDDPGPS